MPELIPVALENVYRLFNVGGTSLVSAAYEGKEDVMAATWVCPLNIVPSRVTACIDSTHYTRPLVEKSGMFALALPTMSIVETVLKLGSISRNDDDQKLEKSGAKFFKMPGFDMPFVEGCACYAVFKVLPQAHIEKAYDLFIGEAVAAWADPRVFDGRHWLFEKAPKSLSTVHYVAGGHFYGIGQVVDVPGYDHMG